MSSVMQSRAHRPLRSKSSDIMSCFSLHEASLDCRQLRLLIAATGTRHSSWAQPLVVRLSKDRRIEMRAVVDDPSPRLNQLIITIQNSPQSGERIDPESSSSRHSGLNICDLVEWADLLVCVPLDANSIGKMLASIADTFLDDLLRSWNRLQKGFIIVPGMDDSTWSNPLIQRQLDELQRAWPCIRVMEPILWHYEDAARPQQASNWGGFRGVLDLIQNQADLLNLGRDVEATTGVVAMSEDRAQILPGLPFELWSRVLSFTGDWELASALGISTILPIPAEWNSQAEEHGDPLHIYLHELERTVLTSNTVAICRKLSQAPSDFHILPVLVVKLIIRFALVEVLGYLERHHPQFFKPFDGTFLPSKASAYYPQAKVLDYWKNSPHFQNRHVYGTEAIDGASKNGHVQILQWWKQSELPLLYTNVSLEQASGNGLILVLDWWRDAAALDHSIVLKPGRSLLWAARNGQADVLRWWHLSGIQLGYSGGVTWTASRWGHAHVLETWRKLKGDDGIIFDGEEVTLTATAHRHVEVLEWWRRFARGLLAGMNGRGVRVEFPTRRIQEAVEGASEHKLGVQEWWFRYKLSLGSEPEGWPPFLHL
ncbi:flavoprotein [Trichoderma ceciliae]